MPNPEFELVSLRAAGTPPDDHHVVSLVLNPDRGESERVYRYRLDLAQAEATALALLDAVAVQRYRASVERFQSPISSGNPNSDGSPQEGQSVWPPAKSSSACCGEE